jgi:predicted unusual protein kinase regulating ubiquinone biosynthesis (AarF/ABC1/UbiB family)
MAYCISFRALLAFLFFISFQLSWAHDDVEFGADPAAASRFEHQAPSSPLIYKPFSEMTTGLHPSEVSKLHTILDQYPVIDLQQSSFSEIVKFLETLNDRFTEALEQTGSYFPEYRIEIFASEVVNAFVYKFRIPGQRFYRGHVFLSTGLIAHLARTMETEISSMSEDQLELLMSAIQGILAHEFAHPKQDELVKWEWREGSDRSRSNHGQGDEMATDLMAMDLLRKSELDPQSMLIGLELLFGFKPLNGQYLRRGAEALVSTHPASKLRVNVVRGGLVQMRREEGRSLVSPVQFDSTLLREELTRLAEEMSEGNRLDRIESKALQSGESVVISFLDEMFKDVFSYGHSKKDFEVYLDWFPALNELLTRYPQIDSSEEEAVLRFFKKVKENASRFFSESAWSFEFDDEFAQSALYSEELTRRAQRLYRDHALFELPVIRSWFESELTQEVWDLGGQSVKTPFYLLSLLFPKKDVVRVFEKSSERLGHYAPELQVLYVLQMFYGFRMMGGATDTEIHLLEYLYELILTSEKAMKQVISALPQIMPSAYGSWAEYLERFIAAGVEKERLTQALAQIFEQLLNAPHLLFKSEVSSLPLFVRDRSFFWEILQWNLHPEEHGRPFLANYHPNSDALTDKFLQVLQRKSWQDVIRGHFENFDGADEASLYGGGLVWELQAFVEDLSSGFNVHQREAILDEILKVTEESNLNSKLFAARLHIETSLIRNIDQKEISFAARRFSKLSRFLSSKGIDHVWEFLEGVESDKGYEGKESVISSVFGGSDRAIMVFSLLSDLGDLPKDSLQSLVERYLFHPDISEKVSQEFLTKLNTTSAFVVWKAYRDSQDPEASSRFLRKILEVFRIKDKKGAFDVEGAHDREVRKLKQINLGYVSDYPKFLEKIAEGLQEDLRSMIGAPHGVKVSDPIYLDAFLENESSVLEFLKLIFNPDGSPIPIEFREMVKFHHLDTLTELFLKRIPSRGLSFEKQLDFWLLFTAYRANRHSDEYFEKFIYTALKNLSEKSRMSQFEEILKFGRIRSERLKVELFSEIVQTEMGSLSEKAGELRDRELQPLLQRLVSWIPGSSRFRDDFLEKMAWDLELTEPQLHKFIEPLKSFNFRSINPLTVNLLSSASVLMEKLKNREKIQLIKYFQSPTGSIRDALPWIAGLSADIDKNLVRLGIRGFDWLDHMESFARDAGEGERLVMMEMAVGSRQVGLWFQGEEVREELYELAGLGGNSVKRELFENYLKALPAYEHSMTLSYLLATMSESSESELLRILEMFDAPGIKFAQMASVLGVFGSERSEELAEAKNRASPPTRAEVFHLLHEHYSHEEFAQVRRVRQLLGSGSIKYVVLVEYEDGSREAVSIRRPHLDNKIRSTMDIAEKWAKELRANPEFSKKYDFDYYLELLREQLADETQFVREYELGEEMAKSYTKVPSHQGWSFASVSPSKFRKQGEQILHFRAIEEAVPFQELSQADREHAGELIVQTELHFLLEKGHFDADRHLGNYLFDPKEKKIYPIDMGQVYRLKPNRLFRAGDQYVIAQMLYAVSHENLIEGGRILAEAFLNVSVTPFGGSKAEAQADLALSLTAILLEKDDLKDKLFSILAELNQRRIRIPLVYTMGVIKGLSIILNEDYAKELSPDFAQRQLERFVKWQLMFGSRYQLIEKCEQWLLGTQ